MDTSETYIKMRREAIPDLGTGISMENSLEYPPNSVAHGVWVDRAGNWYYNTIEETFQLERQDQLQEMVEGYFIDKLEALFIGVRDYYFTQHHPRGKEFPFTSMEQLWLAFVMKENHQKNWNDKWIST